MGKEAVNDILKDENVEVEIGVWCRTPSQLKDHLVLKQHGKNITPR